MPSEHTPGPWYWRLDAEGYAIGLRAKRGGDELDDVVLGIEDKGTLYVPQLVFDEWFLTDANARLIAAAPDLLAACEAWEASLSKQNTVIAPITQHLEAIEITKAALAKTRDGEE